MSSTPKRAPEARPPNLLVLITDQQRAPMHWPDEPGWLRSLMPNDAALRDTGLSFNNAFCSSAMCSPSRASLLTGTYPSRHGVRLTLTAADLKPDPRNTPAVVRTLAGMMRSGEAPRTRVLRQFARGALGIGAGGGGEQGLPSEQANMATLLRDAGYHVAYKGKWHLSHPSGGPDSMLGGWTEADGESLERLYGFGEWEAPDAGENAKAEHFGGGNAGAGEGWDEVYTQQAERWLGRESLPEPFCLIVSLVNPHDVLGYPAQFTQGGYSTAEFADLGVELPATVGEDLSEKPGVQTLMRLGMTAYLGPLRNRREQLDYVNFYAHLHRLVDAKIGRVLGALGDPGDPESLRARTMVVRCSDHGELGLAHGGLRQKMFNTYEETLRVPLVFSNPVLFAEAAETDALCSLVDVVPTMLTLAGAPMPEDLHGIDQTPVLAEAATRGGKSAGGETPAADLGPVLAHRAPAKAVREQVLFSYDDHQAGTAMPEAPGQPNRIRCVRTGNAKYAIYFDPDGKVANEYELYDLDRDPDEVHNLIGVRTGVPADRQAATLREDLAERLDAELGSTGEAQLSTRFSRGD